MPETWAAGTPSTPDQEALLYERERRGHRPLPAAALQVKGTLAPLTAEPCSLGTEKTVLSHTESSWSWTEGRWALLHTALQEPKLC